MSDTIVGPTIYLPGKVLKTPKGAMCDHHPTRPAEVRLVGEVTPEGAELHDYCMPCARLAHAHLSQQYDNVCDLCTRIRPNLTRVRDPDEGVSGRVYEACEECMAKLTNVAPEEDTTSPDDDDDEAEKFTDFAPLH